MTNKVLKLLKTLKDDGHTVKLMIYCKIDDKNIYRKCM